MTAGVITAVAAVVDVSTPDGIRAMIDAARAAFGRVDIVVNNADGMDGYPRFLELSEESFRFHSTTSSQRVLLEDIEYRDVLLEKDAIVWFPLSVATHDPRYADSAGTFDPERERSLRPDHHEVRSPPLGLHPQAEAFVRTLAERLARGAAFFIDYGVKKADYLGAFLKNVNWAAVNGRFASLSG